MSGCNPDKRNEKSSDNSEIVTEDLTIENVSKKIREEPRNHNLFKARSSLYAQEGKFDDAINDLEISQRLDSLDKEVYYSMVDLHMKIGQSGKAKESALKCLSIYPGDKESLLKLAQIYYYVKGYSEALEYIRQIKTYNVQDEDSYFIEGLIYSEMGKKEMAIKSFKMVIEYDSEYIAAYNLLGQILAKDGDPLAIDYFNAGLRKSPDNIELHYNVGYYYQRSEMVDSALSQYNYILSEIDSLHYGAIYNSAYIALVYTRNYPVAVEMFSKAISIDTLAYKAIYNRGYSYEMMGEYNLAEVDYYKALKIEPNYTLAIQGLNSLDKK
jgi:tetratricopeptide (TPR) repeat protein